MKICFLPYSIFSTNSSYVTADNFEAIKNFLDFYNNQIISVCLCRKIFIFA